MADNMNAVSTTDDPKSAWHSMFNSPKHTSKQDRPEREVIAFSTGFLLFPEPITIEDSGTILQWILKVALPILILLSIVCNILIIRVMYLIAQWKFPSCIYVMLLSIIDLAVNTLRILDYWCQVTFSIKFLNSLSVTSDAVCSSFTISVYFLHHLASMIRSALCIELYYSFKYPLENNKKAILYRIEHLILLFISVLLIFNSHFLWTYSLIHMNEKQTLVPPGNYCSYLVKWVSPTFRDVLWPMLDVLIGEICPMCCVLISTIVISVKTPEQICNAPHSYSTFKRDHLDRYMIDVKAFIDIRKFILLYNVATFLLIVLPSTASVTYKGLIYQKNHAMKIVTTFSTARSSTRPYINPMDISIVNFINQVSVAIYPITIVILGWRFSENGFRKELLSLCSSSYKKRKINFLI